MSQSLTRVDADRPTGGGGPAIPGAFAAGRVAGVPFFVHWSVLIITALIAWGLAGQALPAADPGRPTWAYVVTGVGAAVVFVLALLAHELSHAVVARRHGVAVDSITLWLFGGVAKLHSEATDPGSELRIAGVGPLVSFLLGLAFWVLAAALTAAGIGGPVVVALAWLAGINLLLAVFNVLPGAPLDGGRLLRAALWKWRGDRVWASVTAARAGRVLGMVLIGIGLAEFLLLAAPTGIWLALIGWFIVGAASMEERTTRLGASLAGVRVGEVMTASPDTVPAGITVAELIDRYLFTRRHSSFPLVDAAGRPVGLVTLARIKAVAPGARSTTTVGDIAWPVDELPVVAPGDPLADLLPQLTGVADGRALVVVDGRLVGIVSPSDVTRAVEHAVLRRTDVPAA
jgi:Zn-dependent protease